MIEIEIQLNSYVGSLTSIVDRVWIFEIGLVSKIPKDFHAS